jgi:hypothetical protein
MESGFTNALVLASTSGVRNWKINLCSSDTVWRRQSLVSPPHQMVRCFFDFSENVVATGRLGRTLLANAAIADGRIHPEMDRKDLADITGLLRQSKSNEWYTPSVYVEAARKVMGGIDLDPAKR